MSCSPVTHELLVIAIESRLYSSNDPSVKSCIVLIRKSVSFRRCLVLFRTALGHVVPEVHLLMGKVELFLLHKLVGQFLRRLGLMLGYLFGYRNSFVSDGFRFYGLLRYT